jgi:hypothetical protein
MFRLKDLFIMAPVFAGLLGAPGQAAAHAGGGGFHAGDGGFHHGFGGEILDVGAEDLEVDYSWALALDL